MNDVIKVSLQAISKLSRLTTTTTARDQRSFLLPISYRVSIHLQHSIHSTFNHFWKTKAKRTMSSSASSGNQDHDDKHAKFKSQEKVAATSILMRRLFFYAFLASLLIDAYFSQANCLNHLTLWSFVLHTLYFELHLPSSSALIRLYHGPSFCGAHALFAMYIWTLVANPAMEFDLAPEGRAEWVVYARGVWLHLGPVLCHWVDIKINAKLLREAYAYKQYRKSRMFQFWVCLGGYFALALTWEQVNGDAAGTYNVTLVSPEVFVLVSKIIGVIACVAAFSALIKPKLID